MPTAPIPPYPQQGGPRYGGAPPPGTPAQSATDKSDGRLGRRRIAILAAVLTVVAALVGGGVGGVVGYRLAQPSTSTGSSVLDSPLPDADAVAAPAGSVAQVAQTVLPSVVQLKIQGGGRSGAGSGMVLSGDGLILTNNHVVESAAAAGGSVTAVFQDGRTAPAQIVGRDPTSDVAVVKAQGIAGLRPIDLGNSESLRVGQDVVAVGSPLGLGGSVTSGIVSALDRAVSLGQSADRETVINAIQTDAAINPGNSGGPLVDRQGRLVGINTAIATVSSQGGSVGVGFAIPVNQAKRIAEELQKTGQATRPVLGVTIADAANDGGAQISELTPGGAAERAGLKVGDVITKLDNRRITDADELVAAVREHAPGDTVALTVGDRQVQVALASEVVTVPR
ncbi:MAG: trypsin-like peptidase domain-containing protein [Pseudonocardiales bacterium]|nr:trypsin-like peptidase domain-containing protein [Pseudonocardiales bacterium]